LVSGALGGAGIVDAGSGASFTGTPDTGTPDEDVPSVCAQHSAAAVTRAKTILNDIFRVLN
jgi:hypothetical protein